MNKDLALKVLELLQHMQMRPFMFVRLEKLAIVDFLHGLDAGCSVSGIKIGRSDEDAIFQEVIKERGWEWSNRGVWAEMDEKGMENNAIIDEMLAIHIEVLKRRYNL